MRIRSAAFVTAFAACTTLALAQTATKPVAKPAARPAARAATTPVVPTVPKGPLTLVMRGLDKITGRATTLLIPIGKSVEFATLTITARYCYSTPPTEPPETVAFVQIDDHRPDQQARRIFSGWMYASSPGLNGVEHPIYDAWVMSCKALAPGETVAIGPVKPVKPISPDAPDTEKSVELPEGAGQ